MSKVTIAPITTRIRGLSTEVEVGPANGLDSPSVISCDNIITIPLTALDDDPFGHLVLATRAALDHALKYALDILY